MGDRYDFGVIEGKWRTRWDAEGAHRADLGGARRPFLNLMMFPYPSAEGLHVGNVFAFVGSDVQGRYATARGYDVFEPMGYDAFGMHSENYALAVGRHPWTETPRNIARFRRQLERIGNRFDWSRTVDTTDSAYYRWTQWLFLQMHAHGLAYRAGAELNWCPRCKTVLADEQAEGGGCERCGSVVEKRRMEQWFLRITRYAQRLLDGLDGLDWSPATVAAQRRWIGRREGARIRFRMEDTGEPLEVFTTRPDTLWGATFIAVSPERAALAGRWAVSPATESRMPVVVAESVVTDYGTGAVLGVPAHDRRDAEVARARGLPLARVVTHPDAPPEAVYEGEGNLVASGPFTGSTTARARAEIPRWLAERGAGGPAVVYHLHDWCVSRQRYWGTPIPMVWCEQCGAVPVPVADLPVVLPYLENYAPDGSGRSPLARSEVFVNTSCPTCRRPARRETDVADNFLDSSWYYLRYPSVGVDDRALDPERTRRWLPVACYVGGNEHAVLHLLYTRFVSMALHDMGWIEFEEPFVTFRAHGLLVRDGAKMSKSRGNVVNPDTYLDRHGADVLRMALLFTGDFGTGGDFRDTGIPGIERFLAKLWRWATAPASPSAEQPSSASTGHLVEQAVSATVRRVTEDIERLHYNTAISACMELLTVLRAAGDTGRRPGYLEVLLRLLEPFAPFITHEIWERTGGTGMLSAWPWPEPGDKDPPEDATQVVELVVQVNGRLRDRLRLPPGTGREAAVAAALARENVARALGGRKPVRVVLVPGRLLNLVTS